MIHMAEKSTIKSETTVKDFPMFTAEPAALGLIGLAVAALVLASADLGLTSSFKSLMIPWVLFFGATAQLIAKGNEKAVKLHYAIQQYQTKKEIAHDMDLEIKEDQRICRLSASL